MIDLRCGDARAVLAGMANASVDAVVTDPPAGVAFMGQRWDGNRGGRTEWVAWLAGIMAECRRVLKPGHQALVWALPRSSHWTATALEDAGFYVADVITHHFGSGFPKSRSLLKPASEHWILCRAPGPLQPLQIDACRVSIAEPVPHYTPSKSGLGKNGVYGTSTREQGANSPTRYDGRGRWPSNLLLSHVCGPDGCQPTGVRRLPADKRGQGRPRGTFPHSDDAWGNGHRAYTGAETAGAGTEAQQEYVCVDGCPIKALDEQAGSCPSKAGGSSPKSGFWGQAGGCEGVRRDDTGGPSRFSPTFGPDPADAVPFRYQPKASRAERNQGLDGQPHAPVASYGRMAGTPEHGPKYDRPEQNNHPTVKPVALMQWLCKLVTPENGTVLDCFAGSGSTGVACVREGFGFIGIEQSAEYVDIARARIAHEQEQHAGPLFAGVGTTTTAAR